LEIIRKALKDIVSESPNWRWRKIDEDPFLNKG
jgi:hypothetical protein